MGSGICLQTDPQFIDLKILIPLHTTMLLDQTATKSGTVTHTGRKKSSDGLCSRCQRYTYIRLSLSLSRVFFLFLNESYI